MSRHLYHHIKRHLRDHPCHRCIVTAGLVLGIVLAEHGATTPAVIVGLLTNIIWVWGAEPDNPARKE